MANEANGDLGNTWLKTHSATSGALPAGLVEGQRVGHAGGQSRLPSRRPAKTKRVVVRHVPEPGSQRLLLEKGDIDIALEPAAGSAQAAGREQGHQDRVLPLLRHLVHRAEPGRRAAEEPEGAAGAEVSRRLPGHGEHLPQGPLRGAADLPADRLCPAPFPTTPTSSTSPRRRRCWPRPAIRTASSSGSSAPNISPQIDMAQSVQQTMGQAGVKVNIVATDQKQVIAEFRARKHHGDADQLDAGLSRPAHQRRHLRLQRRRQRRRRRIRWPGAAISSSPPSPPRRRRRCRRSTPPSARRCTRSCRRR